jgi:hypothetical protein
MTKHNHYFKNVAHLQQVDVYRILELFEVTCPVAQHIVKKALAAGKRGAKSPARDMQDIVDSAQRWLEMREEDASATQTPGTSSVGFDMPPIMPQTVRIDLLRGSLDAAYNLTKGAA